MLPIDATLQRIKTACSPTKTAKPSLTEAAVARSLEDYGFKREIAGEENFAKAIKAIQLAENSRRGILVIGSPGIGKTQYLRSLMCAYHSRHWQLRYCAKPDDMSQLQNYPETFFGQNVYLDDIGSEDVRHDYGNIRNVVAEFVERFYLERQPNARFFGSSNLGLTKLLPGTTETIETRYGGRVLDRLMDLCVIFLFEGASRRRRVFV